MLFAFFSQVNFISYWPKTMDYSQCGMKTVQILGNLGILGTIGHFENCIDMAFDSTGNIYVTDYKTSSR